MKGDNLPPEHHVIRYVPFGKLRKDENQTPIGIEYTAFLRRDDDDSLSVTWQEYFAGDQLTQITAAVRAIRASNLKPGGKSGFAIGNVATITAACTERRHKIRIIHWPEDDNKAHVDVRQIPRDDLELLEHLAASAWSTLVFNSSIFPAGGEPAPDQPADSQRAATD